MRGGGVGYFDANGNPQPSAGNKSEESAATSIGFVPDNALTGLVRSDAAGFRIVSVSMCNHDIYSGGDQTDPNNPNTTPDGEPRTVNGLFATKAAIAFAKAQYPTGKVILHGTSAGSAGRLLRGLRHAGGGRVAGGRDRRLGQREPRSGRSRAPSRAPAVTTRTGARSRRSPLACTRRLTRPKNQPDLLIARGDLSGADPPHLEQRRSERLRRHADDVHAAPTARPPRWARPTARTSSIRRAIAGLGAGTKSRNLRLCVSPADDPGSCATHVVTSKTTPNTDPAEAADYLATIMDWVHARLGDP